MSSRDRAVQFIRRGWKPVPIPPGQKGPRIPGWNRLRVTEANVDQYFNVPGMNVGMQLGAEPEWLADVDLDAIEAVELAPEFLPPTPYVFGRKSKQRSHWVYYSKGARTAKIEHDRATLVELRSSGLQTVFPGSVHPSGEEIELYENGEPATVDAGELEQAVAMLGEAARLVRSGWGKEAACRVAREGRIDKSPAAQQRQYAEGTFSDAVARYNAEHRQEYPRSNGDCPACGHRGCFGQSGKDKDRWYCYSAAHSEPGLRGAYGFHGDALDLDAYAAGVSRAELLRRGGYLSVPAASASSPAAQPQTASTASSETRKRVRFMSAAEYMDAWRNLPEVATVPTGIASLDKALGGGLPACQVTQIVGGPGSRKSELVRQIRNQVLARDHHVLHVDTELTIGLLGTRDIAQQADLASAVVRDRKGWNDSQAAEIATAQDRIGANKNLWLLCTPPLPVAELEQAVNEAMAQIDSSKPKLVILDSLQQLSFGVEARERRHEVERFISWANKLAQETGSAVLITSERKRQNKGDEGDPLHSAAESKSVEYQSAVMLVLEPVGDVGDQMAGGARAHWEQRVRVVIAKNREGQKGKLPDVLVFKGPAWGFRVEEAQDELQEDVLRQLESGPQTSPDIAAALKKRREAIDSVLLWLIEQQQVFRHNLKFGRVTKAMYSLERDIRRSSDERGAFDARPDLGTSRDERG